MIKVFVNDNCQCAGTKKGTHKEKSLEATSESKHTGCGRDMLGQTVPSTTDQQGRSGQ